MTHCLVLQRGVAAVWLRTGRFQCMKCGHMRISYVYSGNKFCVSLSQEEGKQARMHSSSLPESMFILFTG